MRECDKIELRSEKVRKVIGDVPSGFVRYGISLITCLLIILLVIAYFIPFEGAKNIFDYFRHPPGT